MSSNQVPTDRMELSAGIFRLKDKWLYRLQKLLHIKQGGADGGRILSVYAD